MNQYKDIIQTCSCDLHKRAGLSLSEEAGNWASRPDCEGKSSITSLLSQSGLTMIFQVTLNLRGAFCLRPETERPVTSSQGGYG